MAYGKVPQMKKTGIKVVNGDWVVHAHNGIGQVMDSCCKNIGTGDVVYLEIKTADLTYWLPVNDGSMNHVRHVSSSANFRDALAILRSAPEAIADDFRTRHTYISDEISKGTLTSRARLIRDMHGHHSRKGNDVNENSTLTRLKQQFVDEMVMACKLNRNIAQAKLDSALKKSSPPSLEKKSKF